ncbi:MAG: hypothetical protein AAGA37_06790 [Actinomycetota bacterium]
MMLALYEGSIWPWIIANGLVGIWACGAHLEPRVRHRSLWIAVAAAQAVILAHVIFGAIAQSQDLIEPGEPLVYGLAGLLSCSLIYAYRNEMPEQLHLLYGLGSLWLMGLGIRAAYLVLWFPT